MGGSVTGTLVGKMLGLLVRICVYVKLWYIDGAKYVLNPMEPYVYDAYGKKL